MNQIQVDENDETEYQRNEHDEEESPDGEEIWIISGRQFVNEYLANALAYEQSKQVLFLEVGRLYFYYKIK